MKYPYRMRPPLFKLRRWIRHLFLGEYKSQKCIYCVYFHIRFHGVLGFSSCLKNQGYNTGENPKRFHCGDFNDLW